MQMGEGLDGRDPRKRTSWKSSGMRCCWRWAWADSPSKVVVMQWNGGGDEPPLALVGKGVVFDTGGISSSPPAAWKT
jgi:leucyl aminopeptidase